VKIGESFVKIGESFVKIDVFRENLRKFR